MEFSFKRHKERVYVDNSNHRLRLRLWVGLGFRRSLVFFSISKHFADFLRVHLFFQSGGVAQRFARYLWEAWRRDSQDTSKRKKSTCELEMGYAQRRSDSKETMGRSDGTHQPRTSVVLTSNRFRSHLSSAEHKTWPQTSKPGNGPTSRCSNCGCDSCQLPDLRVPIEPKSGKMNSVKFEA